VFSIRINKFMPPLRILLVDDSLSFLESATRFLSGEAYLEIVGRAFSGGEALEQVSRLRPDLVLMDLAMPGMNGLEATRRIKMQPDAPRVVVLSLNDSNQYRIAAEAVGADGFVAKSEFSTELLTLISGLIG
jgi:DNA-binding NarL/FixJ family response regulator